MNCGYSIWLKIQLLKFKSKRSPSQFHLIDNGRYDVHTAIPLHNPSIFKVGEFVMELWVLEETAFGGVEFPLHIEILVQYAEPMKVRILQLRLWGLAVQSFAIDEISKNSHIAEPVFIIHWNQLEVPSVVKRVFKFPRDM